MGIFGDIGSALSAPIRGVVGLGSGIVGEASGMIGNVLEGPSKLVGRLGTNMLPTITMNHKVTVEGLVIPTQYTVKLEMPELLKAAEAVRDGLLGFDVFGGALKQLVGENQRRDEMVPLLRHILSLINPR
ncbi:MAG: hypothetical protein ACREDR_06010 [Blastocatellia bacterium]